MPDEKISVCPQCGKKYKLKEGFQAASFNCKACGATVWVEGKPKAVVSKSRGRGAAGARRKARGATARGRGRPAAAAPKGRRGGRPRGEAADAEEEGRPGRYERPSSNTNAILAVVGLVVIVAIVIVFVITSKGKDEEQQAATPSSTVPEQPYAPETPTETQIPGQATPSGTGPSTGQASPGLQETPMGSEEDAPADEEETAPPTRRFDGTGASSRTLGTSKWDPPPDLPHLESTPEDTRRKIDDLIALMMDPMAGRDSLDAKEQLIAIGKPAFPRILGTMAKVRDTITDVDSHEERLMESSLKLADEALRQMDGYLEAHNKSSLRPGSEKRYITYIVRLHYKRWMQVLKDMPRMPGPFDPAQAYGEAPEEFN